jgi:hypothetical protein
MCAAAWPPSTARPLTLLLRLALLAVATTPPRVLPASGPCCPLLLLLLLLLLLQAMSYASDQHALAPLLPPGHIICTSAAATATTNALPATHASAADASISGSLLLCRTAVIHSAAVVLPSTRK